MDQKKSPIVREQPSWAQCHCSGSSATAAHGAMDSVGGLVAIASLACFAVGFVWGPLLWQTAESDEQDLSGLHEGMSLPLSQLALGAADWDPRPVRLESDQPLAELRDLPPVEQIQAVDALPLGPALTADQAAGLKALIADDSVIEVVRNNAANRLVQRADDGQLWQFFAEMYANPDESTAWRDYSLQFLSLSTPFAEDVAEAVQQLIDVAQQDAQEYAGTALLHVARLNQAGVEVAPGLVEDVIRSRLGRDDTPDALRHTCLALIGDGQRHELLPLARQELTRDDAGTEALRGALYSLGRLGSAADAQLVQSFSDHAHPAVAQAAAAALARLAQVQPEPSDAGDQS